VLGLLGLLSLLLLTGLDLALFSTSDLLSLGSQFLSGLSVVDLLFNDLESSESVSGFVLQQVVSVVVDQNETSRSTTTEVSVESEGDDILGLPLPVLRMLCYNMLICYLSLIETDGGPFPCSERKIYAQFLRLTKRSSFEGATPFAESLPSLLPSGPR